MQNSHHFFFQKCDINMNINTKKIVSFLDAYVIKLRSYSLN